MEHLIFLSVVFLAGFVLLIKASDWLVSSIGLMARYLKISEYAASFLLMASATSIPELFVGMNAALSGIPTLSLGNVLGANLLNVTGVIGVMALLGAVRLQNERVAHEAGFIFILTLTPLIFLFDGVLSRIDGAILILLFFAHLRYLFAASKIKDSSMNSMQPTPAAFNAFVKNLFVLLGGVVVLLAASWIIVFAAESGARVLGVPPFLIGMIVLSLGTTLPELMFGIRSAISKHGGMGLGNAVGSVVFNLLFILGVVALISPISVTGIRQPIFVNLVAVSALILFLHLILRIFGRIPRSIGAVLLFTYIILALFLFGLSFPAPA